MVDLEVIVHSIAETTIYYDAPFQDSTNKEEETIFAHNGSPDDPKIVLTYYLVELCINANEIKNINGTSAEFCFETRSQWWT